VERIHRGAQWTNWDENTFYTPGPKGYTDYAYLEG
jgi:N-ethylmaleimide reductase